MKFERPFNKVNIFAIVLLMLTVVSVSLVAVNDNGSDALPANFYDSNGVYYKATAADEVSVISSGYTGNITIPAMVSNGVDDFKVTGIAADAFKSKTAVTGITFETPSNVKTIGNHAFYGTSITTLVIPDSVISLGTHSVQGCHNLTDVTLGNSLTTIDACAFYGDENLGVIDIPNSVTTLGASVFESCGATEINIGSGVTTLSSRLFYNTTRLTTMDIPDTVTDIMSNAFFNSSVESVVIGDGVTTIGSHAFQQCRNLTSVSFGMGLDTIEALGFYDCDQLESAIIPTVHTLGSQAFGLCDSLTTVHVGDAIETSDAFKGCTALTTVTFEPGITMIGNSAFQNCTGLQSIDIPDTVTVIGSHAFQNTGLTSVTIPSTVTDIESVAFYGCAYLASVTISNTTALGDQAFNHCDNLEGLTVIHSVSPEPANSILNTVDSNWGLKKGSFSSITIIVSENLTMDGKTMMNRLSATSLLSFIDPENKVVLTDGSGAQVQVDGKTFTKVSSTSGWNEDSTYVTVTFDGRGGTVEPATITVASGSMIVLPTLSLPGYTGSLYYMDGTVETPFTTTTIVDENMNVYAKWTEIPFTISYDINGGTGSIAPSVVTRSDLASSYRLPSSSGLTAPAGKHFIGWSIGAASALYDAGSTIPASMITGNTTMVAMWGTLGYSVIYNLQGGTAGTYAPESWVIGVYKVVSSPTKDGNNFIGWRITGNINSSALYGSNSSSIINPLPSNGLITFSDPEIYFIDLSVNGGRVVLVALWESTEEESIISKNVNVSFNSCGGYPVQSITVKYGQAYGTLPTPLNEDLTFDGWYFNGAMITSSSIVTEKGDHTLVAKWKTSINSDVIDDDEHDKDPLIIVCAASALLLMMLMILAYVKIRKT